MRSLTAGHAPQEILGCCDPPSVRWMEPRWGSKVSPKPRKVQQRRSASTKSIRSLAVCSSPGKLSSNPSGSSLRASASSARMRAAARPRANASGFNPQATVPSVVSSFIVASCRAVGRTLASGSARRSLSSRDRLQVKVDFKSRSFFESMRISEVARKTSLRASALRYYESIELLPAPMRINGRRRYGPDVLLLLAGSPSGAAGRLHRGGNQIPVLRLSERCKAIGALVGAGTGKVG